MNWRTGIVVCCVGIAAALLGSAVSAVRADTTPKEAVSATPGRFTVTAGKDSEYVLCDSVTGKTWWMDLDEKRKASGLVWVPLLTRLETEAELRKWMESQKEKE